MRRWIGALLLPVLILFTFVPASAADPLLIPGPILMSPEKRVIGKPLLPVAFSPLANRYQGVDPATVFDLNGDRMGDIKVSGATVAAQNGAQVQLIAPAALNLDEVQSVPGAGYSASAPLQLSRVYAVQLPGGGYAKFMLLQASPTVTIWFQYGVPTSSVLKADGQGSRVVLTWGALADAALGYNIYRYAVEENGGTLTQLNDFTVAETTFTDSTAANRYYLYAVQALKADGSPGAMTTVAPVFAQYQQHSLVVAPVFVQYQQHSLVVALATGTAKLDGATVSPGAKPVIKNGWLMVPASLLTHAGVKAVFQAPTNRLTLTRRIENLTYTMVMTLDSPDYTRNGTTYQTDVPAYKAGAEVMVPLRVVAPVLGLGVTFSSTDRTATLQWAD